MKTRLSTFLLAVALIVLTAAPTEACWRLHRQQPVAPCPQAVASCCDNVQNMGSDTEQSRAVWYEYYGQVYYSGSWHYDGRFNHPVYSVVENNRAQYLAGGSNRWASNIYTINVNRNQASQPGTARMSLLTNYVAECTFIVSGGSSVSVSGSGTSPAAARSDAESKCRLMGYTIIGYGGCTITP